MDYLNQIAHKYELSSRDLLALKKHLSNLPTDELERSSLEDITYRFLLEDLMSNITLNSSET